MTRKKLFNDGWSFAKLPQGTGYEAAKNADFSSVNLPHDYLIYQGLDLYENSSGWYRKIFDFDKDYSSRYELYFEGVYMDVSVYLNDTKVGEWKYGYSSFFFDVTDYLKRGENYLYVGINYQSPNTRWYSGAGIYRDVYLLTYPSCHFVTDSLYVSMAPEIKGGILNESTDLSGEWKVIVDAEINGGEVQRGNGPVGYQLEISIPELGVKTLRSASSLIHAENDDGSLLLEHSLMVKQPELWDINNPKLYDLELRLIKDERVEDTYECRIGFRSVVFTVDHGMFLNGRHIKINGVCEHHDLGAVGAAFHKPAMRRKLLILREMGVNAIRTSHNMPAPGLLELTDEMGFLVMDESFDMWERPKTEFDYARFFKDWYKRDVRNWIRRDRNHPSIIMWSIGNEIYDTHADERGQVVTKLLKKEVELYDYRGNAVVSIGSNYMPWKGAQKCANILKYAGYNYGEKYYDEHHKEHPDWYIFGSETASTVQSRGIYHFPFKQSMLADDDEQCSGLGHSTTSWGADNPEFCVNVERDHEFSLGQFLWSGFDYIGEPTPYHTRNSYFGQIDTAGFFKDSAYVYRAGWTDAATAPFVHLFPYWDFNPGQEVDVRCVTNGAAVELFVNGKSKGRVDIDRATCKYYGGNYLVNYEPGEIVAVAYDAEGKEIARASRHSFGDVAKLVLTPFEPERPLVAGNGDMAFVTISAVDREGYPVENATNPITVTVEGAGYLGGLDNGDSTDLDEYKGSRKRLFGGLCLAQIMVGAETGTIKVTASAPGVEGAELLLEVPEQETVPGISLIPECFGEAAPFLADAQSEEIRKIELSCDTSVLNKDCSEVLVTAKIYPEGALVNPEELIWKTVTDACVDSPLAKVVSVDGCTAKIKALGDGSFRLRCMTRNGSKLVKVISTLNFEVKDLGQALLDPYGFVPGAMWSYSENELGNGNEHGVSTARLERSVVGFEYVNFGSFGSDEITIPIFELGGNPIALQIWEGVPGAKDSEMLADVVYHKPSIWNVYQPDTYKLKRRISGVKTLCLVLNDKIHIKGFSFKQLEKAYEELKGSDRSAVYGDKFTETEDRIDGIGNNVTVEYDDMDFGNEGALRICIKGYTPKENNTIHLLFTDEAGASVREILEFPHSEEAAEVSFAIGKVVGSKKVQLVFLPGSEFDLHSIRFEKA